MKPVIYLIFFLQPFLTLFGQTINLQIGPSFSKLNWENSLIKHSMFNYNVTGINASFGIDYWDKKFYNLSSNMGFVQKGGKDSISVTSPLGETDSMSLFKIKLNYITLNTAFILKYPIKNTITPYLLVGPRIDYLISYEEDFAFIKQFEDGEKLNHLIYGFITGFGINYRLNKAQLGIIFNYYLNFNKLVDYQWENSDVTNKVSDNTFTLNFQIGYKL